MTEPSESFVYPSDEPIKDDKTPPQEILLHLLFLLLESRNPKLKLCAIAYAAGIDISYILGCENTITDISKRLGVSKQCFHQQLKLECDRLGFDLKHVQGSKQERDNYKYANFLKKT